MWVKKIVFLCICGVVVKGDARSRRAGRLTGVLVRWRQSRPSLELAVDAHAH